MVPAAADDESFISGADDVSFIKRTRFTSRAGSRASDAKRLGGGLVLLVLSLVAWRLMPGSATSVNILQALEDKLGGSLDEQRIHQSSLLNEKEYKKAKLAIRAQKDAEEARLAKIWLKVQEEQEAQEDW